MSLGMQSLKDGKRGWISKSSFNIDSRSSQSSEDNPDGQLSDSITRDGFIGLGRRQPRGFVPLLSSGKTGAVLFNSRELDMFLGL